MSYRSRHIKTKIHRIKPKKSIFKSRVFWIALASLLTVIFAVYFLLFYPGLQINNIEISGNKKTNTDYINSAVLGSITKTFIKAGNWELSSRSILLADTAGISAKVLKKFPAIASANAAKKLPQTITLNVVEREPFAVFCRDYSAGGCYFIDKNGIIFEAAGDILQYDFMLLQNSENGQIFAGEQVIAENIMQAISKIERMLKDNFQVDIKQALVSNPFALSLQTAENWKIYFNTGGDIDSQIMEMDALLKEELLPAARKNLEYIDLRFEGKAYYK